MCQYFKFIFTALFLFSSSILTAQIHNLDICELKTYSFNENVSDFTRFTIEQNKWTIQLDIRGKKATITNENEGLIFTIISDRDRSKYKDDYQYYFPTALDFVGDTCQILFVELMDLGKEKAWFTITYPKKKKLVYFCEERVSF